MHTTYSSRRTFLKGIGAASIITTVGMGSLGSVAAAAPATATTAAAPMFRVDYADDVRVVFTGGRRFDVTVTDLDGNVLERHRWLTARRLFRVRSARFTVSAVDPESVNITR